MTAPWEGASLAGGLCARPVFDAASGFLSWLSMRRELVSGALRTVSLPGFRMQRAFSWVLPAADLAGMAGDFVRYARANVHQFS